MLAPRDPNMGIPHIRLSITVFGKLSTCEGSTETSARLKTEYRSARCSGPVKCIWWLRVPQSDRQQVICSSWQRPLHTIVISGADLQAMGRACASKDVPLRALN